MVKADIVSALCEKGYYKNQANDVVDEVLQIIRDALVRGEQVQLRGFGTFEVKTRKSPPGRCGYRAIARYPRSEPVTA